MYEWCLFRMFTSICCRALNYGTLGSLMAKDLLHLLLPDSKSVWTSIWICMCECLSLFNHLLCFSSLVHTKANPESESMCIWSHYLSVTKDPERVRHILSFPLWTAGGLGAVLCSTSGTGCKRIYSCTEVFNLLCHGPPNMIILWKCTHPQAI